MSSVVQTSFGTSVYRLFRRFQVLQVLINLGLAAAFAVVLLGYASV